MLSAAQSPQDPSCRLQQSADEAEPASARSYSSLRLKAIQLNWNWTLSFLTDPATSYQDRMAAAYQTAGEAVRPQDLPALWKAVALYGRGHWVQAAPCEWVHAATPRGAHTGLPAYPVTAEDRAKAPWQWQAARALAVVNQRVTQYYAADPARYSRMVEEAWKSPPADYWEAFERWQALARGPRNVEWLRTLVRLSLTDPHIGYAAPQSLNVCCQDTFHFEELVHVAQLVVLRSVKDAQGAQQAAYWAGRLARDQYSNNSGLRPLRTKTGVLEVARWALNTRVDPFTRYYSFVGPLMQMLDDPPVRMDPQMSPANPKVRAALDRFEQWYAAQRTHLEQEAAAEKPQLQKLTEELLAGADPSAWSKGR